MRILVFHGYLLRGTGSNVYTASLAAALVALGHEVHLLCQERDPEALPFVDAAGTWSGGALRVRIVRRPVRCTVYRPDVGEVLPVYVADRYEGLTARPFPELTPAELDAYIAANVGAVRDVVARREPEVALANHLVMGPAILARALQGTKVTYAVKVHGSALEYTVKPHPRFVPYAREGVAAARGVLVGSRHVAESLWEALPDQPGLRGRTRLGPPGVDLEVFAPHPPADARAALAALAARLERQSPVSREAAVTSAFTRDAAAAGAALRVAVARPDDRLIAFVGKLIVSKGADLLLAAWPLVLQHVPQARLLVVGFGAYREGLEGLVAALGARDLSGVRDLAARGRAAEGGPRSRLTYLIAFLDELEQGDAGVRERYLRAAAQMPERVTFTGRLEHAELADVLPACEGMVVPSTFPEAFGMVAAEGAACGALPLSAAHSGLAEVSRTLARGVPERARPWLSFSLGPATVRELAERQNAWLDAPEQLRAATRRGLATTAREHFGWAAVARRVIAAAEGRLDELPEAF